MDERWDGALGSAGMTPSGARLIVTATATACAYVVVALPRAVEPREPPHLVPASGGERDRGPDLPSDPRIERLVELVLARGEFERGGSEPTTATEERASRTRMLARAVESQLGERALRDVARHLAHRVDQRAHGDSEENPRILGDFERQLARHGVTRAGTMVGPRIVTRALACARIATLFGMEPTRFMTTAEEEAYFAWAALRPGADQRELRAFGAEGYARMNPTRAAEARAYFAYVDGEYDLAARLYQGVYDETGEFRARNHALAALVRAVDR
jgi:hypothetical protein